MRNILPQIRHGEEKTIGRQTQPML